MAKPTRVERAAALLGVTPDRLRRVIMEVGAQYGGNRVLFVRSAPADVQRWERIRALLAQGMTQREVARREGVARQNISQLVKRWGDQ